MNGSSLRSKVSGSDSDIVKSFLSLVGKTNVATLREINLITSDLINSRLNPPTQDPPEQELDNLFNYVPNFVPTVDPDISVSSTIQPRNERLPINLNELKAELESLNLNSVPHTKQVKTQWLLKPGFNGKHNDLKNAKDITNFPIVHKLMDLVNESEHCKGSVNGCIINCYQSGSVRQRPHSDDECYINQDVSIATFSLGASRKFGIFTKTHKKQKSLREYTLDSNSLFFMQPGSQTCTKHRVLPSTGDSTQSSEVRYSISFRGILPSNQEHNNQTNPTLNSNNPSRDTTLIFGSSISKRLNEEKLVGKSNKLCVNLSVSGAKIRDVASHMEDFYSQTHKYFSSENFVSLDSMNITDVIICVGANDVLNSRSSPSRLYAPIQGMVHKAKSLFNCRVHLQNLVPIPNPTKKIVDDVYCFNDTLLRVCRTERCHYIDLFNDFRRSGDLNKLFYVKQSGNIDIHPNRLGQSIMAKAYIPIVRSYFNPFSN